MKYRSTRSSETVTALEALVKGLASDGGLYVPSALPAPFLTADDLMHLSYEELAAYVLSHFFTDIPEEDMKKLTPEKVYDIYREVSISKEKLQKILERIKAVL